MSDARRPGQPTTPEERHAERILALCVVTSRVFNLGIALSAILASRTPNRRPMRRAGLLALLAAVESTHFVAGTRHVTSVADRRLVWTDVIVAACLTAAGARAGAGPDTDWLFQYSLTSVSAAAMGLGPGPESAAATLILAAARLAGSRPGDRIAGEAIAYPGTLLAVGAMARFTRRAARDLGAARAAAVRHGEEVAAQRERLRQHRLLHDSALQTLEAAAGRWDLDPETVRRRATLEARHIRLALDGDAPTETLPNALGSLAAEFLPLGLQVRVDMGATGVDVGPEAAAALRDAVREALTNVRKHAGTGGAAVTARRLPDSVEVVVSDAGAGFDPARSRPGFGLRGSVDARLAEVGGDAAVESRPGAGTRVVLRVPA